MRRILIAATILAAACGKKSVPATAEIKATAAQAQQGMSSASTNTQASIGLQSIGSNVVDAVSSGGASTVDLSVGLSDPGTVAAVAMAPPSPGLAQNLRASDPGANLATVLPVGCLMRGPGQTPTLYSSGQGSCSATDHLEVSYDNGDQVNLTWSETSSSFDLLFVVVAGPWTGTNLRYTGTSTVSRASATVSGAMKYSKVGNPAHVDADFDLTYTVTGSQSTDGATVSIRVNGTATDRLALVRANENWNLGMQSSTSGQTQTVTIDWSGGIGIDLLKPDGSTTDHSVAFDLNLHVVSASSPQGGTVAWSAGGDVEYDGGVAGSLLAKDNLLYIRWNDGAEESFNPTVLFGSFGV